MALKYTYNLIKSNVAKPRLVGLKHVPMNKLKDIYVWALNKAIFNEEKKKYFLKIVLFLFKG